MGSQIGVEFAIHGFEVVFLTAHRDKGEARVRATLARAEDLGLLAESRRVETGARVRFVEGVDALPTEAALVLECLPEDFALKVAVLGEVAARAKGAPIASNTSSLSITELGAAAAAPARLVGLHYWNPPLLMPLVELTPGSDVAPGVVARVRHLAEQAGKTVVLVRRDVPGFVWNRLQMAVLREALWLVTNDVASIDDVDRVTTLGLARRWRETGLFASIHLGGPDTWERVAANLFPTLSDAQDAAGLADLVSGASASWSGSLERRDRALARDRGPEPVGDHPTGVAER
jgi:3-hydroxybutyryl-CoA dehydrogenase